MERIEKINGEEFTVRKGKGDCLLEVVNGDDIGIVTWHQATRRYRGEFNGWGVDCDSVEVAVARAANRIMGTRKGVSRKDACEAMEKYLEG